MSNAGDKLQEAQYFLDQMRSHSGGTQDFMFKLSAFLSAARSVMDLLLYDYGIQYGLFTINDKIYPDDFQRLAQGNSMATSFYIWWSQKRDYLATHQIGGFLSEKRHIVVHRGQPAMAWSLVLAETISFHSGLSFNPPSAAAGSAPPNAIDVTTVAPPTVSTTSQLLTGYFADYPSESVVDLCEKYLQMLSSIVAEARTRFP